MHPDTMSTFAAQHRRDLDDEAARRSLAGSVPRKPRGVNLGARLAGLQGRLVTALPHRARRPQPSDR
jgi:hypothetical protein